MPKPLTPEQLSALQDNGVVIPGYGSPETEVSTSTMPAGLIQRTLGSTGLPHTVSVERIEDNLDTPKEDGLLEPLGDTDIEASYLASHNATTVIMGLMGETTPDLNDPHLISRLDKLKPAFKLLKTHGYQPEVVLLPVNQDLSFWYTMAKDVQDSTLNPDEPDPDNPGNTRKVLRNNGLFATYKVAEAYNLNGNKSKGALAQNIAWDLEIMSTLDAPVINDVTGYGYTDDKNQLPSEDLNNLLEDLSMLPVRQRLTRKSKKLTLRQPNINPSYGVYVMHQLIRIVHQKPPMDTTAASLLHGSLSNGDVLAGYWDSHSGRIVLGTRSADFRHFTTGIRPSVWHALTFLPV